MKIAVVGMRGIPGVAGGVEAHCEALYPRIVERGADVTCYVRRPYIAENLMYQGVGVVPLSAPQGRGLEAFAHTAIAMRRAAAEGCDILHVHSIGPAALLPFARLVGHRRIVVTVHSPDYLQAKWGKLGQAVLRFGERQAARRSDALITVAQWFGDDLVRSHRAKPHIISNGPGLGAADGSAGVGILDSLGVESGRYVLFVGRLIPDKRVEDLLMAAADLDVDVVIAGDTSDTDEYAASLKRIAGPRARFPGYVYGDELAALYEHAQALVLPSAIEGLPVTLIEAMRFGVPVVASDIRANREVLAHGETGLLYPLGDVEALRDAIQCALEPGSDVRQMVRRGRLRVEQLYDWDTLADRTMSVYREVLEGGRTETLADRTMSGYRELLEGSR